MDDNAVKEPAPQNLAPAAENQAQEQAAGEQLRGTTATDTALAEAQAGAEVVPSRLAEAEAWEPVHVPWGPGEQGGQALGRLESAGWDAEGGRLVARGPAGATLIVQPLGPAILRLTLLAPGAGAPYPSFAVLPEALDAIQAPGEAAHAAPVGTATGDGWTIATASGAISVGNDGGVRWVRPDGEVLFATAPGAAGRAGFGWDADWAWVWLARNPNAGYFGFGERTGPLDRSEKHMTFWAADVGPHHPSTDAMYQSIPAGVVWDPTTGHTSGLFADHPGLQRWDIGQVEASAVCISARAPALDLYVFAGPTMPDVLAQYTALTGRTPLPPHWAIGFQQSRWSYFPAGQVLAIAEEFRRRNLPGDVIYLDIDYMRGFRDFTFDPRGFPNAAGMTARLRELGFRLVVILDPGVKRDRGYRVYDEMFRNQYYVKWPDGRPFVGTVWPGPCVFPDFFQARVRDWWAYQHQPLLEAGVAGIWDDMNEPAVASEKPPEGMMPGQTWAAGTMPFDVVHETTGGSRPHGQVHSAYGFHMARATAEGLDRLRPDARRYVLTRSGYAGVQRYATVWTGDNQSWWEHLAMSVSMCLGMGLSGVAFVGADIGGFNDRATGELYLRWLQFGAFMPLMRGHYNSHDSRGQDQEPWSFGPEIESHARAAIELRYRLLPYLYSLFREAQQTGAAILRPLAWEFPHDPRGRTVDYEALCGPALLVAPVLRPGVGAQAVYLPAGRWGHYFTGAVYEGGQDVLVPTPLAHFPLFLRAGSIIPLGEPARNAEAAMQTPITLLTLPPAPGADPMPPFRWYEDDGASPAYRQGAYHEVPLRCERDPAGRIVVTVGPATGGWQPPDRAVRLLVAGMEAEPLRVFVNGETVRDATWEQTGEHVTIPLPPLPEGAPLRVEIEP